LARFPFSAVSCPSSSSTKHRGRGSQLACENLNDDHPAAGAGQDARLIRGSGLLLFGLSNTRGSTEPLACARDVGGTMAAGE
jgi:hypothetical protein